MSERLTKRDKYGHAYTNETIYDRGMTSKDGVHFEKHYFENGTSAYDGKPIDRLCELEDKIEQGEIVELPCVVGSEAYHLTSADTLDELGVAEIFNGKVCSFSKDEKGLWIFCRYDNGLTYWYKETDIGTMLFLDRAAAEAKLREMEGIDNEKTDK